MIDQDEMIWILTVLSQYSAYPDLRQVAKLLASKVIYDDLEDNPEEESLEIN